MKLNGEPRNEPLHLWPIDPHQGCQSLSTNGAGTAAEPRAEA